VFAELSQTRYPWSYYSGPELNLTSDDFNDLGHFCLQLSKYATSGEDGQKRDNFLQQQLFSDTTSSDATRNMLGDNFRARGTTQLWDIHNFDKVQLFHETTCDV
jgi:hypothetical protein